jgi:hypothetical protein
MLERAELALLRQEHETHQAGEADALAAQHQRELDALVLRLTGVRNDLLAAQQEELEVFSRRMQVRRCWCDESCCSCGIGGRRLRGPPSRVASSRISLFSADSVLFAQ